jgi:signal transduction histidine kinase
VHEHFRANNERRFVEVVAAPLWGGDGAFQGIIESMRDITEHVEAEEALQQYAERLRALSARLAEVAEAERQRLARELHDQVGQNLTALGINLNIVRTQLPEEAAASVRSRMDDSLSLVEQTTERIRDLMANLRPPVLDDYGLVTALHWYGGQFTDRTAIAVAVQGEEPIPRLAAHVENALFRIAQEALTNAAKHAQATQVVVTVEVESGTLRLIVADDGIGFDLEHLTEPNGSRGWGLLTMTERAEGVGGHCRIETGPGRGTQVIVEVSRPGGPKL